MSDRLNTGNEYISISEIDTSCAGIRVIGFLHQGFRACVELHGSEMCPLLRPVLEVAGESSEAIRLETEVVSHWIPGFTLSSPSVKASATIFAPLERRGFVCVLAVENTSGAEVRVRAGWQGCWEATYHTANLRKRMAGVKHAGISSWREGVPVVEYRGHTPLFATALVSDRPMPARVWGAEEEEPEHWTGQTVSARPGRPVHYSLVDEISLAPSERRVVPVYVGLGLEEVSAVTSACDLQLHGHERLLAHLTAWLEKRAIECEDESIGRLINANSFYNYFFAQGIALDTERHVLTSARSSRSNACAAYRDHDSMLWSLPAVLQINWAQARKMLIYTYTTQLQNAGLHSRFVDGIALEPGMQLDQLCAPLRALRCYVQTTDDMSVLFDRRVQTGVNQIQQILAAQRHPDIALFETLLLPSGVPSTYPYVCYSNVLVWRILQDVSWLYERIRDLDRAEEASRLCGLVRDAIWEHMVVDGPDGRMFALSVDLRGNHELGDDPAGSLKLLSYYEFCEPDEPVCANTLNYIQAQEAERWSDPTPGEGRSQADGVSLLAVINDLFTARRDQALEFLRSARLDDGIACEFVDPETGAATGGMASASCAGFLAFGLRTALGAAAPGVAVVKQQRRPSETLYQPPPESSEDVRKARL